MGMNGINSLSHSKWNCKYHIVFAPKYRRKVFYKSKRTAIGKILRELCEWKGAKIIEAEACPDHIHLAAGRSYLRVNASCEEQRAMPAHEEPPVLPAVLFLHQKHILS